MSRSDWPARIKAVVEKERAMTYCSVTERLFHVIRTLEEEQRKPVEYGDGMVLGHAEMQLLETIFRYPDENVSALSLRMGITKGAVTQVVTKLMDKQLLSRVQRDGNRQKAYFKPTPHGRDIIERHHRHHRKANRQLCEFITTLEDQEARSVFRFLECLTECVPFSQFPCECEKVREIEKEDVEYGQAIALCARPLCRP